MLHVFLGGFIWKRHRDLKKCRISLGKKKAAQAAVRMEELDEPMGNQRNR